MRKPGVWRLPHDSVALLSLVSRLLSLALSSFLFASLLLQTYYCYYGTGPL